MDYRNLFGIAAIILSGAVFVHSLKSANAFPQGPNVSMGSNPYESFYGNANTASHTFQNDFIITTIISNSSGCSPLIDGNSLSIGNSIQNIFHYDYRYPTPSPFVTGNANFKISAGSTVTFSSCGTYHMEGYHTH